MTSRDCVLFVSPGPSIAEPESGEAARLHHLSRRLAKTWEVRTMVPEAVGEERPEWATEQYTYRQWSMPFLTDLNPSFLRAIHRIVTDDPVDVVHASSGVCAARLAAALDGDVTVIYAAQNVEADHAHDFVDPDLPPHKRLLGPRLVPLIERATVSCADGTTTVSEKDRDRFLELYGLDANSVRAVPTGTERVDESELVEPSAVRRRYGLGDGPVAVFHGFYDHPPNREAAEAIDDEIAPVLRERGEDVEFLLVGKDPPRTSSPNVHPVGFVDDLYSVLNATDLAVVPIQHGGGTKTKIYDYVSLGLPIVTTEKGIEGIDLEDGTHAFVTEAMDEEFITLIEKLLSVNEMRENIAENLGDLAREWDWEQSSRRLSEFYRTV